MSGLAQTFDVADNRWFYNAVDSRLYRVGAGGGALPSPTADVPFGYSDEQLRERFQRGPVSLTLNVTEQCNLRCRYCVFSGSYSGERTHNDRRMSREVALRGVEQFMDQSVAQERVTIGFFGGEPLAAFDRIQEVVAYVRQRYPERRCQFTLTTNGTCLSRKVTDFLRRERFAFGVSLDGPQAIHDANRRFASERGSWQVVTRNLAALKAADPDYYHSHVGLMAVLSDPRRIAEMHDYFSSDPLVCENLLLVTQLRVDDAEESLLPALAAEETAAYEEYLEQLGQHFAAEVLADVERPDHFAQALFAGQIRTIHGRSTRPLEEERLPAGLCVAGAEKLFLAADGTYYVCPSLSGSLPIGDCQSGVDVEKGLALTRDFLALGEHDCRECWAVRFCRACFVRARQGDKLSLSRRRAWCATFLHQLERAFRIYLAVSSQDRTAWSRFYATRPVNFLESLAD